MILEGFEIENWACIRKLSVSDLPRSGVIVFHGPNRTGKSNVVRALRACLMDNSSTSTALKSFYPRGTSEKPTVSVIFTIGERTFRIKKCFGSNKSELASRTSSGDWRTETATATEAHTHVCNLVGGDSSYKGLRQLLWLTQAEFQLPDPRKFDTGVQAQLRNVLGVLQTPLDDRFIERVKKRWNEWYSGQRKAGREQKVKEACRLAQNREQLRAGKDDLRECDTKFNEVEVLIRQTADLEALRLDLERQFSKRSLELHARQEEWTISQTRIAARRLSEEKHSRAQAEEQAALAEGKSRNEAANRVAEIQKAIDPLKVNVEAAEKVVKSLGIKQTQLRSDLNSRRAKQRDLQQRMKCIDYRLRALDDLNNLSIALEKLLHAEGVDQAITALEGYLAENPVPGKAELEAMKANYQKCTQLRADQVAASLQLTLSPDKNAGAASIGLDGTPPRNLAMSPSPETYTVHRKFELQIPDWGRVELNRGVSDTELDQIEAVLQKCQAEFEDAIASFGIATTDPDAFDQLLRRSAEHKLKSSELAVRRGDLKKIAPKGIEPLRRNVLELEAKRKSADAALLTDTDLLPMERIELDRLKDDIGETINTLDGEIETLDAESNAAREELDRARREFDGAKDKLLACEVTAAGRLEVLSNLRSDEQIVERIEAAQRAVVNTNEQLKYSELTAGELTIDERLKASTEAVKALEAQIRGTEGKYNTIKGRLESSEGLHATRSALSARVDELTRLTEAESVESHAMDRLYELFEECREKQLGTLIAPISDRVLSWMRVLDIGDYKEMRFSDAFLPDKLIRRDGTAELDLTEESTGAQEQIGMLVRLALGSLLTSVDEPEVAILDDPLTHCDVGRLNGMRAILRRASEGDSKLSRPAGPLQIIIFTCHPEWFQDERAAVIDLEDVSVMQRFSV